MGVSTNAYLFFGYNLNDMHDSTCNIEQELKEYYGHGESFGGGVRELLEHLTGDFEIQFDTHGHCDHPAFFIHSFIFTAYRGSPENINELPKISSDVISNLEAAAKILGITGKPKWILASDWC